MVKKSKKADWAKLSARAHGIFLFIMFTETSISGHAISSVLTEGIKAVQTALKELRDAGFIETKRIRLESGEIRTESKVTQAGFVYFNSLFSDAKFTDERMMGLIWNREFSSSWSKYQGSNHTPTPAVITSEVLEAPELEPHEEPINSVEMQKKRLEEFEVGQRKKRKKWYQEREGKPQENWTATDVTFEIADRLFDNWEIKPWKVTQSRFTPALAAARRRHGTNGAQELRMWERFWTTFKYDKESNADVIWQTYIYRFPALMKDDSLYHVSDEKMARAIAQSEDPRNWRGF